MKKLRRSSSAAERHGPSDAIGFGGQRCQTALETHKPLRACPLSFSKPSLATSPPASAQSSHEDLPLFFLTHSGGWRPGWRPSPPPGWSGRCAWIQADRGVGERPARRDTMQPAFFSDLGSFFESFEPRSKCSTPLGNPRLVFLKLLF